MRAPLIVGLLIATGLCTAASSAAAQTTPAKVKASSRSICKDGTTSTVTGTGACASHGGVDSVATAAARASSKATKADAKAAKVAGDTAKSHAAASKAARADAKAQKAEDKAAKDSTGATAQCKDGTYWHAKTMQNACSAHGGVAKTLKP